MTRSRRSCREEGERLGCNGRKMAKNRPEERIEGTGHGSKGPIVLGATLLRHTSITMEIKIELTMTSRPKE